ncbi:neuropilin-1-like [Oculina patagonica]
MYLHSKQRVSILIFFTLVFSVTQWTNAQGCKAEALGVKVPSPKRIPDKYMTSSSDQSSSYQAFRGRIGLESRGSWGDGWCASEADINPYIQIFFEHLTNIVVIESEGVIIDDEKMWVKSYEVQISNDTKSWTTYFEGDISQMQANTGVQAKNVTLKNIWAHFIRIFPKSRNGKWRCMRLALYGCQTDGPTMVLPNDVLNDAANSDKPLDETFFLVIPIALFGCVIIASLMCFCCCRHKPKRARKIKEKQEKREEKQKYFADQANTGKDNGVIYEQPPPYEFQTVSLDFEHDDKEDGAKGAQAETPVFIDDNKIFSFDRNAITYS